MSRSILKLTFRSRKIHVSNRVDEPNMMVSFLLSFIVSLISKQFSTENHLISIIDLILDQPESDSKYDVY